MITGGTGSFGSAFTRFLLSTTTAKIRIYSRDEHKQEDLARELNNDRVTFVLGDIRDYARFVRACDGCDSLVHAAALKIVGMGEQHVTEFISVDVNGSEVVTHAAIEAGIKRSILVSSDKACMPINTYGKCKALAEDIFIYANRLIVSRGLKFSVVRGGNVWGSRGSVVEVWRKQKADAQILKVYNPDTTRFHLPMAEWCAFVWRVLNEQHGGEIFVPRLWAWCLGDLADAIGGKQEVHVRRNGDKADEMLISPYEIGRAKDIGWSYVIEPPMELREVWNYKAHEMAKYMPLEFAQGYSSDKVELLSVKELEAML